MLRKQRSVLRSSISVVGKYHYSAVLCGTYDSSGSLENVIHPRKGIGVVVSDTLVALYIKMLFYYVLLI